MVGHHLSERCTLLTVFKPRTLEQGVEAIQRCTQHILLLDIPVKCLLLLLTL